MDAFDGNNAGWQALLAEQYPTKTQLVAEIAKLEAQLELPRQTELFASDIHGEYNAFSHLLRTGSGALGAAIEAVFGAQLNAPEKAELLTLIAYPSEKCQVIHSEGRNLNEYLTQQLPRVAAVARHVAARHTTAHVRALMPQALQPLTSALLSTAPGHQDATAAAVQAFAKNGEGVTLTCALGQLIQHLLVDRLHLVGDVFDRGPAPDLIMDELLQHPHVDVQWGNHDILWIGAALGQPGSVANVVRICARYGNLPLLEDAYGINLRPLAAFANQTYGSDPCEVFALKGNPGLSEAEAQLSARIQKAMALIQFKVEARLINENPSFGLADRNLLHLVDRQNATVVVDGVTYDMLDVNFPTVDWADPYALTQDEQAVIDHLCAAFQNSEKLQRHAHFFLERGSLYRIENNNLLLHACVPLNPDGTLKEVELFGQTYRGKSLYDKVDQLVRAAFAATDAQERQRGLDMLWYLWLGPGSPLFAKSKMATFELYFIADKAARKEVKNAFYTLTEDNAVLDAIFEDFGMNSQTSHIICGHVPVKAKDGEDPIKAGGRVLMIDGGFSAAYQKTTGLAGYTLVSNSEGMFLDSNEPLASRTTAIRDNADIKSTRRTIAQAPSPQKIKDTSEGTKIQSRITLLQQLL